jgi:hypothetical protein
MISVLGLALGNVVPAFTGEVIDGIVATVNRRPLLRSEWDEAVRFEAFMQQKRLAEVSESERVAALQRLIDRELLTAQMADPKTMEDSAQDAKEQVAKLRAQLPGGKDDANWQALLAGYGLNETMLAAHLKDEVRVMNFIDVQLRPNVRIQDSEVQAYYRQHFAGESSSRGTTPVPLADVEPKIHELLVQQRMDEMLDAWLHNLRQQSHIHTLVPLPALSAELRQRGAEGK